MEASYYRIIYDIIVLIATLIIIVTFNSNKAIFKKNRYSDRILFWFAAFFALFIGLRPVSLEFVDMVSYAFRLDWHRSSTFVFTMDTDNKIFDNLMLYASAKQWSKALFFLVISSIYFICTYFAIKRLFKTNSFAAYVVWLGSFSTFSYGVNGIKAGAAAAVFLLAISFYDKKYLSVLLSLVSVGFHHSMILCVLAYIAVILFKKSNYYLAFWCICLLISAIHVTYFQELFGSMTSEHDSSYLLTFDGENFGGKGGFRFDFVLYSLFPIIIGYIALFKKRLKSRRYSIIYNFYLLTNGIWMLCMYASFTNRIAYLSWFIYPVVLSYPLLEMKWGRNQYKVMSLIVAFNLFFTLFMTYVYY